MQTTIHVKITDEGIVVIIMWPYSRYEDTVWFTFLVTGSDDNLKITDDVAYNRLNSDLKHRILQISRDLLYKKIYTEGTQIEESITCYVDSTTMTLRL